MTIIEPIIVLCSGIATIGWAGSFFTDNSTFHIMKYFSLVPLIMFDLILVEYIVNYIKEKKLRNKTE